MKTYFDEKAAQVAENAARLISERGHYKGSYEGPDGSLCLIGAVWEAAGMPTHITLNACANRVMEWVQEYLDAMSIVRWNDRIETTGEDVILVLKKAAEELRS